MPTPSSFDYAIIRLVPRVEREEFINVGVVLFCVQHRFLGARVELDEARLKALSPDADVELLKGHLESFRRVCAGGKDAGPSGGCRRRSASTGWWRRAARCSRRDRSTRDCARSRRRRSST